MADLCFDGVGPYQRAVDCSGSARPGARALMAHYLESVPAGFSLGIYNCRTIGGTSILSTHAEGRAIDAGIPVDNHDPLYQWLEQVAPHAGRLGIAYVIFDRTKWRAQDPCGAAYGGRNPHLDHAHIELTRAAAELLNLATLRAVVGDFRTDPIGDNDVKELIARRQAVLVRAGYDLGDWTPHLPAGDPDSLPGCDGVYGDATRTAEDTFAADALAGGIVVPHDHDVRVAFDGRFTSSQA